MIEPTLETVYMRKKVPSTTALQIFEAAARHNNFSRAAVELSLTEGAVSRQIARLESLINCQLFDRAGSRIQLNSVGEHYADQVREILERLDRDTQYISGMHKKNSHLNIAALPTFSSRWLIPRLSRFKKRHPEITLNIAARTDPFILSGSGFDAAVHFEDPAWAGMNISVLFQERLIPVCHPALLSNGNIPEQLNVLPLIHRRQNPDAWYRYAQESGVVIDNPARGPRYDLHEMAIAAALNGQGVALLPRMYIENELNSGVLVSPWLASDTLSKTFCLITPPGPETHDMALRAFQSWLQTEVTINN